MRILPGLTEDHGRAVYRRSPFVPVLVQYPDIGRIRVVGGHPLIADRTVGRVCRCSRTFIDRIQQPDHAAMVPPPGPEAHVDLRARGTQQRLVGDRLGIEFCREPGVGKFRNFLDRIREDRGEERPGRAVADHGCASLRDPSEKERCGNDTGKDHNPCKDQDPGISPGFFLGRRHWITLPFLESNSDLNDPRVYALTASTARGLNQVHRRARETGRTAHHLSHIRLQNMILRIGSPVFRRTTLQG
ncbi:hypothetical protein ASZ90_016150 [hydrocarbon metagenome]|uniref:Uncharacterized protein n=1 Tax=hydrocarbon metagenome TaxID=938273 RepID=A0A0W8EZY8_9ZZZZ